MHAITFPQGHVNTAQFLLKIHIPIVLMLAGIICRTAAIDLSLHVMAVNRRIKLGCSFINCPQNICAAHFSLKQNIFQ
jgi:hypothetical protein